MMKRFNADSLRHMTLFSKITGIMPLECFEVNSYMIFILKNGTAAKAIGSGGKNIKLIKNTLKKEVKVIEEADSVERLVENYLFPLHPRKVELEESETGQKILLITFRVRGERQTLLGNNKQGLNCIKEVVKYFYPDVLDVKIP